MCAFVYCFTALQLLVHVVAWCFPEFQFLWLAEETKRNLPLELDFVHEAKNCERVGAMFQDVTYLKVPQVYWELTTERVLCMEFCEGGQVNDKEYMSKNKIDVSEVCRNTCSTYVIFCLVPSGYVEANIEVNVYAFLVY